MVDEIRTQTSQYGKAKLILKNCRYYIETQDRNFLDALMNQNPFVRDAYERCLVERKKESQNRTMTKEQQSEELKIQLEAMRNG
jgi:hypothetical protein